MCCLKIISDNKFSTVIIYINKNIKLFFANKFQKIKQNLINQAN